MKFSGFSVQGSGLAKRLLPVLAVAALALLQAGCASIAQVAAAAGEAAGVVTPSQAQSIVKTGEAFGKAWEQITPEQEYYVGRAVGASIASTYKIHKNDEATRYINLVGQSVAMMSDKPETFGGYHFLILETEDINAFAAPGGFIFLSRGMLRLCRDEDELAAVLAHEVAHVNLGHAIKAISNSRWTSAFTILGTESAKGFGGEQLAQLTAAFEGSIQDITGKLITSGYARGAEKDADKLAVTIMKRVGYDATALPRVLKNMESKLKPGGLDFAKTHPPPAARIADLMALLGGAQSKVAAAARVKRFNAAMQGV